MRHITLTNKEDLDILLSPQRQHILRILRLKGAPMTAKDIGMAMDISPSSAQHHIKKLLKLGCVEIDRVEKIRGILATYYVAAEVTINIGADTGDFAEEKEVLMHTLISDVFNGFVQAAKHPEANQSTGDLMTGVLYLSREEMAQLLAQAREYMAKHEKPLPNTVPVEFAFIAYTAQETSQP